MLEFWIIFSFSFLVALTGALVPGPLLTYTIIKTLQTKKSSYLTGLWIVIGHALLESLMVIALLFGFSALIKIPIIIKSIGIFGGLLLIYMGIDIIISISKFNIQDIEINKTDNNSVGIIKNPIIGGILVSMSNPYWWIWWATIGFSFLIQYNITLNKFYLLLAFIIGHEFGDLSWYLLVSSIVSLGKKRFNNLLYRGILLTCAVLITGFGFYIGISIFLK